MNELIDKALSIGGVTLTFDDFTIKGFPGFNLTRLYRGEQSLYEIEKQNFSFQIATKDVVKYDISANDTLTISDNVYLYDFIVELDPIHDLTGWSELHVNFQGKEEL